jgi:hypothetical protein
MAKPVNFNEYLADCPKETHAALKLIHKTIKCCTRCYGADQL